MPTWDPDIYGRYKVYRDRPALDLLLQVPGDLAPQEIWDLGCGPGEHAALLAARHPEARVRGLDSSPAMLDRARQRKTRAEWIEGDIAAFQPDAPVDLLFTNAALQWLDGHDVLFPRLAGMLAPGGVLACQMPKGQDQAWHEMLGGLAQSPAWRARLGELRGVLPVAEPAAYFDWLSPICGEVDIWTTTYLHVLEGDDPVVDWMSGTALRPYLDRLADAVEREAFLADLRARLVQALPPREDGLTLLPFPRLFIVARR